MLGALGRGFEFLGQGVVVPRVHDGHGRQRHRGDGEQRKDRVKLGGN